MMPNRSDPSRGGGTSPLDVSVVIPTYNRPDRLVRCLRALAAQDYPRERFEVLVVDDGGTAPLAPIVDQFRDTLTVTLVAQSNTGPARARNHGAARARGRWLAFTDDDCAPRRDWLTRLVACGQDSPDAIVGGHTINALRDNVCAIASQALIDYLYAHHASRNGIAPPFFTSNNFIVAAERFRAVGGFDATFRLAAGEDREFCDRWQAQGGVLRYAPDAVIFHRHDLSLRRFWRQHTNYGRGACHLRRVRTRQGRAPIARERLWFYLRLVGYPLRQPGQWPAVRVAGLMALSQLANAYGYFREAIRRPPPPFANISTL
jgi:GT2 family glycosyltransferase